MFNIGDKVVVNINDKKLSDKPLKIKTEIVDIVSDEIGTALCVLYKNGFDINKFINKDYIGKKGWYIVPSDVILHVIG